MPIPNVSTLYQRINKGSEGGNEFARFIRLLLSTEYQSRGEIFISESDASGDYKKVDGYIPGDEDFKKNITGFQFKFFPSPLTNKHKGEIIKSIEAALKENEFIQEFILITPEDFQKKEQSWLEGLQEKYETNYYCESNGLRRRCGFKLFHWGHSKIIELALKNETIGHHYFPELYPIGIGKFKLSEINIDCESCSWQPSTKRKHAFYQSLMDKRQGLTSDPVFDFQFTNSSPEIFLLKKIEIHIEKVLSLIKGIPLDYFLKSIGTIEYEIDFNKPINTISFSNPMVFNANQPLRFKLQLTHFTKNCPGNYAEIKFVFHFNNATIPTNNFYLSF